MEKHTRATILERGPETLRELKSACAEAWMAGRDDRHIQKAIDTLEAALSAARRVVAT
jgi:hypothetical protein